jgi:small redox-active disulfide protein 2
MSFLAKLFGSKEEEKVNTNENARILVLGSGCANCHKLEENVKEALKKKGMEEAIGHIYDMKTIMSYGVVATPGLVVDGKVVSSGKILSVDEVLEVI